MTCLDTKISKTEVLGGSKRFPVKIWTVIIWTVKIWTFILWTVIMWTNVELFVYVTQRSMRTGTTSGDVSNFGRRYVFGFKHAHKLG